MTCEAEPQCGVTQMARPFVSLIGNLEECILRSTDIILSVSIAILKYWAYFKVACLGLEQKSSLSSRLN